MRILFFILLQFFAAFVWSAEENFDDRIVNYLVSFIEQNEAYNDSLIQRGESEKVNRTIYIDFNEILQDEPRVLKAYATTIDDLSEEYPKTKKSSDIFNTIQDQIKFYNVIIGAMPDYFKIIQQPNTYRYGNKIANTGGVYDSYSGYYSIGNYYGANQETLYKLMRNTLSRVSEVVEVGDNVVFNYFAFTKKQTPKKPVYINFVHTDFVGDLFVPHLQDLKTDLTGMMAAANSTVYSNSQYSIDDKLNYHLGASVKVLLNKRSEENSILELAILEGDTHESILPWNCEHDEYGVHVHGAHILTQFLQDNGFTILANTNTSADDPPVVYAAQPQEGGGFIEYEVEFRAGMSADEVWEILTNWGVTNKYDYCCYRFGDNSNRNITDWISWYDNYALETPPFVVDLIARLVAGPFISMYGYWYREDAITGEALTGLDYFLNAFDLLPVLGAVSNALDLGVKSVRFRSAAGALIGSTADYVKNIPTKLYTFVKEMSSKALALMPKANGALVVVAKETSGAVREIIEFGADQVIKVLREIDPGLAPPQVVYDLGGVSVRQGDDIVERQLQIVKTGDGQVFVKIVSSNSKLDEILSKHGFSGPTGIFQKLPRNTDNQIARYTSLSTFNDEFIRLHGLNTGGIRTLDEVLDDFDNLITNHWNVPEVERYVDELMQSKNKFKGGAYGLELLNNLPPNLQGKTLTKFEASIDDLEDAETACRFDMEFSDGIKSVYVETKNYASTTNFSASFYNQFSSYLQKASRLDEIQYYFRANLNVTDEFMKNKFKNLLNSKADDIFKPISEGGLFTSQKLELLFGTSSKSEFLEIIQDLDDPIFDFIMVY